MKKIALAIGTLAWLFFVPTHNVNADLWTGGGFEGGLGWTGTDLFMGETATEGAAPGAARFFDMMDPDMITESGTWIEDSSRTYEGDRMFWLRDYNDPDTICAGRRFNGLTAGDVYDLKWSFAAFNPNNPTGTSTLTSKPIVEVMTWDTTIGDWVLWEPKLYLSDGQVSDPLGGNQVEYELQDWDNLNWTQSTSRFAIPELNGRPMYLWVSMTNDSNGLLIDGITFTAVPEPAALTLSGLALLLMGCVRIRKR
ncbi:MAG: hypothetical protein AAFN77_05520 [Planctomycetota bacterium]